MKKIFSFVIIVLLLCACESKYKVISTNEALELIDNGAKIIDVRTVEEYNDGHIKGAINIPLDEIDTINYSHEQALIVYCASGVRSLDAVKKLADMGYTNLYNLDGGLLNWGSDLEE